MKVKRKLLCMLMVLLITALFTGCGKQVKSETELQEDLLACSDFYLIEGSEISELSILKRLTDKENRTDKVYVEVTVDHPAAKESKAYIMHYTCYNNGWCLDAIEEYHGQEAEWTFAPKQVPTNERIMDELIDYSNAIIDEDYKGWDFVDGFSHAYFFEEGKYVAYVYSGEMNSDSTYSCVVTAKRVFNYVVVDETMLLNFVFDRLTYEWALDNVQTMQLNGHWYLDGQWVVPTSGAMIQLESNEIGRGPEPSRIYNVYRGTCTYNGNMQEFGFNVSLPSSQHMSYGYTSFGSKVFGPVSLSISIFHDKIWCHDWIYDSDFELIPVSMDNSFVLETTGLVGVVTDEGTESYRGLAKEVMDSIFVSQDIAHIREMWISNINQEYLSNVEEIILSDEYQAKPVVHMYTKVTSADDPEAQKTFSELREAGFDAEEIAVCMYYLEEFDGASYEAVRIMFAKQGEQVKIFYIGA